MRVLVFLFLVFLAVSGLASPLPERSNYELQRPPRIPQFVKGQKPRVPNLDLRKGEYICGNKICKLKTGQIPPNCGAECQYPV